ALLLGLFGALSQLGTSFYYASARLMVTRLVPPQDRTEAIAWQRTGNNLAQILSYSLGAFFGRFGTAFLLLFDSFTSFLAAGVGAKILPPAAPSPTATARESRDRGGAANFYRGAMIIALFTFVYELYITAAAAECKTLFGSEGLQIFSKIMVINTFLCAIFSVFAARYLRRAELALPAGIALLAIGCLITFRPGAAEGAFYLGSLLVTLGEIVFNALSGIVLIVITPPGKRQASLYSRGVLLQFVGRIAGASAAFPLVVDGAHPLFVIFVGCVAGLLLCVESRSMLREAR
ncbi:MAG: MFS transporter, partial [Bdellovibrionota bacterium]